MGVPIGDAKEQPDAMVTAMTKLAGLMDRLWPIAIAMGANSAQQAVLDITSVKIEINANRSPKNSTGE